MLTLDLDRIAAIRAHHDFSAPSLTNLAEKLLLVIEEITEAFREDRAYLPLDEITFEVETGFWCKAHHRLDCGICGERHTANGTLMHAWERYTHQKPDGFPIELADAMMRIADIAYSLNIDLQHAIHTKLEYNAIRPTGHGRKC